MKKIHFLTVLATLLLGTAVSTHAEDTLVSWDQSVKQSFDSTGCVSLPAIPGVPKQCTPAETVRYPCGVNKNLSPKMCSHRFAGVCTPAIPSIKATKVCAGNALGALTAEVQGDVSAEWQQTGLFVAMDNEVTFKGFGQEVSIPVTCVVPVGLVSAPICLDVFTGEISSITDKNITCETGVKTGGIEYKGVEAKVCAELNVQKKDGYGGVMEGFSGSVALTLEAQVAFGSVTIAGHTIRLASKVWKPTILTSNFLSPPKINPVILNKNVPGANGGGIRDLPKDNW
jgi:hypothetical protein